MSQRPALAVPPRTVLRRAAAPPTARLVRRALAAVAALASFSLATLPYAPAALAGGRARPARAAPTSPLVGGPGRGDRSGAGGQVAFTVKDSRITESSGLATSRIHPGIVYTHNDSGGSATVYALGPDGGTRAALTIAGAGARDWEAIATGPDEHGRPSIFVADIGDNLGGAWPYVTVYRVPEPARLTGQTLRATAFRLKYSDGPRNAETLMVHPRTGRLYVASKLLGGALYAAPPRLRTGGVNVLRRVGDAPPLATDGAFSPDGRSFVIRTYFDATAYSMSDQGRIEQLAHVSLPSQDQGESVTFASDGRALLVGSEGVDEPVYRVPLPADALPSPAASSGQGGTGGEGAGKGGGGGGTSTTTGASGGGGGGRDISGRRLGLVAALTVSGVLAYAIFRRRA